MFRFAEPYDTRFKSVIGPLVESLTGLKYLDARAFYEPKVFKMDLIHRLIENARLIICDLSEKNPNVFLEYGMAYAMGKRIVLICSRSNYEKAWKNEIPFDVRGRDLLIYENDRDLRVQLGKHIFDALYETHFAPTSWVAFPVKGKTDIANHAVPSKIEFNDGGEVWSASAFSPPFTIRYQVEELKALGKSKPDLRLLLAPRMRGRPKIMTIFPWENGWECHVDYVDPLSDDDTAKRLCQKTLHERQIASHENFASFAWPHFIFESTLFDEDTHRVAVSFEEFARLNYPIAQPQHIGFVAVHTSARIIDLEIKEITM